VAVLWFMDKVSEKAQAQKGKYSSTHNRTNLSTRIAQYTGAINPKKAISTEDLNEMVVQQKSKIDHEFMALIQSFKESNVACYNQLFGEEGSSECSLNQVEATFTQLLAINSKIKSTDLISLDAHLKGGLNETKFQIGQYVD